MKKVRSIVELIGKTPLIRLDAFRDEGDASIFAKIEYMSICGSIKDRVGLAMVEAAEREGKIHKGGTLVEPTAGNTGIGVALAGAIKGYRTVIVMPEGYSEAKMALIRGLGAELVLVPRGERMAGAIEKAAEMAGKIPGAVMLNQFSNPANPRIHFETTGPEIWEQMEGKVDAFVAGAGTGGSFTGIVGFLRTKNPCLKAVLADPPGSIFAGRPYESPRRVEGIGNSFWPEVFDRSLIGEVLTILDEETYFYVEELGKKGFLVGSSSGCNFAAAKRVAKKVGPSGRVVTLFPDSSERYLKKFAYDGHVDGERLGTGII